MTDATVLPDNWRLRRVGDYLKLQNGYAFKPSDWSTTGDPIIRIQNLNSSQASYNYFRGSLPDRFRARHGDLLFAWSGTPGTSFGAHVWTGGDAWINQHIFRVDFSEQDFDRDFLRLALNFNLNSYVAEAQGGVGLAHITKAKLNDSVLVTPPLDEQRAIARTVEAAETLRRSAQARLSTARHAIDRFRQAVLASAYVDAAKTEGAEAQVPLEALLREPFKNGYSARPVNHKTPFRVLTLTATTSGWFDPRHFKYTDEQFTSDSPFWLCPDDILVQRGNTAEYVGVPALYDGEPGAFLYPDLMIRVRVRPDVRARFVWYMLLAPQARNYLRERATGSAGNMPKINQAVLASVPLPFPPAPARDEIVQRLDAAFSLTDGVGQRIDEVVRQVTRSSQAVLAKAFRGELSDGTVRDGTQP